MLLAGAVVWLVVVSWRWPVVNDAALMHYVVLMMERGWAPYAGIRDINLPGAYLPDWVAMRIADGTGWSGDLVWRAYDLGLLGVVAAAMVVVARPGDWFAGVFAGGLFALFHGRDGIGQTGQRDLGIAALVMVGWAAAWVALGRPREAPDRGGDVRPGAADLRWLVLGGLTVGLATTVKPFGALYFVALLVWVALVLRGRGRVQAWGALGLGFAVPLAALVVFLLREHALGSFVEMCRVSLPFHAGITARPWREMVGEAWPRSFAKLGAVALVLMVVRGSWRAEQTRVVLVGLAIGLFCFLAQRKGYSYQRYPYAEFLLLWVGIECTSALRDRRLVVRGMGLGGLLFGLCLCVPGYLRAATRAQWEEPYLAALQRDLVAAGGASLDGRVQCVDSISGCVNVLYRMRLTQATGTLYDEFLFPPKRLAGSGRVPEAVVAGQWAFLHELAERPPRVMVVSSWLFADGPGGWAKLALWPAFAEYLTAGYVLVDEQRFGVGENGPLGFRVYVRRGK